MQYRAGFSIFIDSSNMLIIFYQCAFNFILILTHIVAKFLYCQKLMLIFKVDCLDSGIFCSSSFNVFCYFLVSPPKSPNWVGLLRSKMGKHNYSGIPSWRRGLGRLTFYLSTSIPLPPSSRGNS